MRLEERHIRLGKLKGNWSNVDWTCRYLFAAARRYRDLTLQRPARIRFVSRIILVRGLSSSGSSLIMSSNAVGSVRVRQRPNQGLSR